MSGVPLDEWASERVSHIGGKSRVVMTGVGRGYICLYLLFERGLV